MKHAFLVQILGCWGSGQTIAEAAENCALAGAGNIDRAVVDLIIGDDTPEVSHGGLGLLLEEGSEIIRILADEPLGKLRRLKTEFRKKGSK